MQIIDEPLLDRFRCQGFCEWCRQRTRQRIEPHHYFIRRGMGGGSRLDHPYNLIGLCGPGLNNCHNRVHDGHILKIDLLLIVADREQVSQDQIKETLWAIGQMIGG